MRLTVSFGGKPTTVEVADDLSTVRVGDRSYPLRVVATGPTRVELEVGGESVVIEGWPEHLAAPPGPVDVNGERWPATVGVDSTESGRALAVPNAPGPTSSPPGPAGLPSSAEGIAIVPPMPGRVVELRVREGQAVAKGTVLLVLEAMKMRNEVAAPGDGVVRDLRVREGSNVRARETMLVLGPAS